jgi:hypothetical protein
MKGKRNAALTPGQRGRIAWMQSLSGDELQLFEQLSNAQGVSDEELKQLARLKSKELFSEWLKLQKSKVEPE